MTTLARDASIREIGAAEALALLPEIEAWIGAPNLAHTYPQVYGPSGGARSFGAVVDGRIRSHAAARRVSITGAPDAGSSERLRATLIGSVATDPAWRGRGLATALLDRIADVEQQAGQHALLLWSDNWAFYARLGYQPVGTQHELELRPEPVACAVSAVRPATLADLPALCALHAQKPCRVERDLGETALLFSVAGMSTFVLEQDGVVAAYACLDKGADFQGWWHEVGGRDEHVADLLHMATALAGRPTATVLVPPYRTRLLDRLCGSARSAQTGAVALAKRLGGEATCEPFLDSGAFFVDGLDSI